MGLGCLLSLSLASRALAQDPAGAPSPSTTEPEGESLARSGNEGEATEPGEPLKEPLAKGMRPLRRRRARSEPVEPGDEEPATQAEPTANFRSASRAPSHSKNPSASG